MCERRSEAPKKRGTCLCETAVCSFLSFNLKPQQRTHPGKIFSLRTLGGRTVSAACRFPSSFDLSCLIVPIEVAPQPNRGAISARHLLIHKLENLKFPGLSESLAGRARRGCLLYGRALLQKFRCGRSTFGLIRGASGTLLLLVEARVANAMHLGFTLLLFTAHAMETTTTASAISVSVPFSQWWIVWGFTQF